VDGIWGPNTQAAYNNYLSSQQNSNNNPWATPTSSNLFDSYYQTILNQINVPTVSMDIPSADSIRSQWQDALRPSVDAAINRRQTTSQNAKAELDADAVSRGMGSSTYVSSVKERESANAQDDIGEIESIYGANLAERIAASLQSYDQMRLAVQQHNQQAQQSAQQAALSLAGSWYNSYLSQQQSAASSSSKSSSSSGNSSSSTAKVSSNLAASDYLTYVEKLSSSQREQLFTSSESYWKVRRDSSGGFHELIAALGSNSYLGLRERYLGK